ncbi:unnamed protein product [Zymoseptoria tritici ST99CH_1A5]|uniref:RRM domain-containing protein n=1 Tax=Zymoseptoria tritici ST99CH_1A5 TaxID=1276529 RepID=A0A1Y6L8W7_ZYMTR|nr:unnamed protein product [Zymoseptoria tritici ST99CH_1A5]
MASSEQVTVDKSYFDALLRRADFHTNARVLEPRNVPRVTISQEEYDVLLRSSQEYDFLKNQLLQGGLSHEALESLLVGAGDAELDQNGTDWADEVTDTQYTRRNTETQRRYQPHAFGNENGSQNFNSTPGQARTHYTAHAPSPTSLKVPSTHRNGTNGASHTPEDAFGDDDSFLDEASPAEAFSTGVHNENQRTLYFTGFPPRTTYEDLVSVIRGGKLLSINLRSEKSATVTFLDGAAEYLTWAKRNDVYIHSKRIEVRWAERQFRLNNHIAHKITNGATRNIRIRGAVDKGLTEDVIRDDMEHIHNLIIISVEFRKGDAFVSTNSVHNALFARTCMMSRSSYKGCKIEFYPDECDVPLPARNLHVKNGGREPDARNTSLANRFDMLDIDGTGSSDDEGGVAT